MPQSYSSAIHPDSPFCWRLHSASSTMYDIDVGSDSGLSDGETPPVIPVRTASVLAKKGMKFDGGIDLSNAIWTSARTYSSFRRNVFDDEDPGPKRQCVTRHQ